MDSYTYVNTPYCLIKDSMEFLILHEKSILSLNRHYGVFRVSSSITGISPSIHARDSKIFRSSSPRTFLSDAMFSVRRNTAAHFLKIRKQKCSDIPPFFAKFEHDKQAQVCQCIKKL